MPPLNPPYFPLFTFRIKNTDKHYFIMIESIVRIERDEVWYEILTMDQHKIEYTPNNSEAVSNCIQRFTMKCEATKVFFDVNGATVSKEGKRVELKPAKLQISEEERIVKMLENDYLLKPLKKQ